MTRGEAIWHAKHVFNIVIERCINAQNLEDAREFDEAKQIVIEALQQEPCDKRTDKRTETHACDCISRQDAIEALDQDVMGGLNYRRILRLLPSADRPTGHWIETEHSTNENGFKKWIEIRCPFCGHEPVYENIDDMEFCPKCGADMRGGDTK